MPRKKKEPQMSDDSNQVQSDPATGTALLDPPIEAVPMAIPAEETSPVLTTSVPASTQTGNGHTVNGSTGNGQRRPAASWKFPAAAGVTIEVALWPHTITLQSGESIEVYNATITRSYKDAQGNWQKGGSFRVAELMVLRHAIEVAHAHALNARELNCPI